MKRWIPSSKHQEATTGPTNTKEEISLEEMKQRVEKVALEWDDFVIQTQLKYVMYVYHSLCSDPRKDKLIYGLKFKNYMRFKINTTRKFF